jgi:Zn-dependent protease
MLEDLSAQSLCFHWAYRIDVTKPHSKTPPLEEKILRIAVLALPILVAIVFHEVAHGWVANRLGDPTAKHMGRLTLNPLPHIDPIGTVALPLLLIIAGAPFLFGYAKPVPVNFYNLRNPKRDMILVALAGPATNLLLALGAILVLKVAAFMFAAATPSGAGSAVISFLSPILLMAEYAVIINVVLAVFNALPLLPLDGGRVLVGLLPEPHSSLIARLEPFGFLIIIVLLMTHMLGRIIGPPINFLLRFYFGLL